MTCLAFCNVDLSSLETDVSPFFLTGLWMCRSCSRCMSFTFSDCIKKKQIGCFEKLPWNCLCEIKMISCFVESFGHAIIFRLHCGVTSTDILFCIALKLFPQVQIPTPKFCLEIGNELVDMSLPREPSLYLPSLSHRLLSVKASLHCECTLATLL